MSQLNEDNTRNWYKELRDNGHIAQLHGNQDFITHSGLLYVVHRLFRNVDISTKCVFIDRDKKIAEYEATIKVCSPIELKINDNEYTRQSCSPGVYIANGDACPDTCNRSMAKVYKRFAETRAINRALRLIVGGVVGMCSVEELDNKEETHLSEYEIEAIATANSISILNKWAKNHNGEQGFKTLLTFVNCSESFKHYSKMGPFCTWPSQAIDRFKKALIDNKDNLLNDYESFLGKPTKEEIDADNNYQKLESSL
jgi:surface antigen